MAAVDPPRRYGCFGLDLISEVDFPGRWRHVADGGPRVRVQIGDARRLAEGGTAREGWSGETDGRRLTVTHGAGEELLFRLEPGSAYHLSPDGSVLSIPDPAGDWPIGLRTLLDSVLFSVALQLGHDALHAGAVSVNGRVLAVCGPTGAGKTSLAGALMGLGAGFVADDVLVLRQSAEDLFAAPGPPLRTVPDVERGGDVVAQLDGERWIAVEGAAEELPLGGIVTLGPAGEPEKPAWSAHLAHLLRFPATRVREQGRFELAAALGAVPTLRLQARSGSPEQLASQALDWFRDLDPHWGAR